MKSFLVTLLFGLGVASPSFAYISDRKPIQDDGYIQLHGVEGVDFAADQSNNLEDPIELEHGIVEKPEDFDTIGIQSTNIHPDILQDAFLDAAGLIDKYGYPVERYDVQTADGYILEVIRIPGSPISPVSQGKQPVFLMHGLLDSCSTWVIMGPNQGFAYMLADLGYDVWLGNARGNRYSRRHVNLNPERRRFWQFSWHEIGIFDLPAMIDFVLQKTGFSKLHYAGHSQGTTSFFVMGAERPAYNEKILSMHALAPVAFMSNLRSPFVRAMTLFLNTLDFATSVLGVHEFMPHSELLALGGQAACKDAAFTQAICSNVLFLIAGFSEDQLNSTMIPVILGHTPAGAATMQLIHYGQGVRSGRFRQYDHGYISNLIEYGSMRPPNYDLSKITAPVALHYSANDWMAEPIDVEELHQGLPNVLGKFLIPLPEFNHLDFVWAIDARTLVYNRVVSIMQLIDNGHL